VLTYVGRLERYKGVMELLRCFRILVTDYPGLALRIVGQGPLSPAINRFISEARLSQSVKVHPFVRDEHLVELLSSSDIFVLPSRYEAFGLAAAEAMACEVPVVASAVGGLRELVVDGETGILLPSPVKIRDLRSALEKLIVDGELRVRMGANARARILSLYRLERMLELHRQIYMSTGKRGRASTV
jgi:glycosyltransferase involved in cell wall biosynthesis